MPTFARNQPASFDGIKFAVRGGRVRGGIRDHVHTFPHADGGVPELLGRELYMFELDAIFVATAYRDYPEAWPVDRDALREKFDRSTRGPLVYPTIGELQAYAKTWDFSWTTANLDGETSTLVFREDASDALLLAKDVPTSAGALGAKMDLIIYEAELIDVGDIFDSIKSFVNSIKAYADTAQLIGDIYASKVQGLADTCRSLVNTADELQLPRAHKVLRGVIDLGVSAIKMHADLLNKLAPTFIYTTPTDMDIFAVARAMYGSTDRVMDLLRMNPIADIDLIPGGTGITGYHKKAA